jgi:peptidyl-prolyl cis-trans isomerase B (cyclophilin B)
MPLVLLIFGTGLVVVSGQAASGIAPASPATTATATPPAPRLLLETSAGSFTIETYPGDAPLTVHHIVGLAKERFYDGQRVHRAVPGVLVQFGDPQTRDETKRHLWGRGLAASSGTAIGAAEIVRSRVHRAGAVGVAHMGEPTRADSQFYIALGPQPQLDGRYAIFGQVIEGAEVPGQLRVGDSVLRVTALP